MVLTRSVGFCSPDTGTESASLSQGNGGRGSRGEFAAGRN